MTSRKIDQLDGAIWLHFVIAVWRAKRIHEQEFVECYEEVCCRIYRHVRARLCWNSQSINNPPFRQIGVVIGLDLGGAELKGGVDHMHVQRIKFQVPVSFPAQS